MGVKHGAVPGSEGASVHVNHCCYSRAWNSESESGWVSLTRSHGYSSVLDVALAES